jgi:hypothetical protein
MQETVSLRYIRNFHILRIPGELLVRESQGNITEKPDLRQQAGIFKVGAGGCSLLAGENPFLMMPAIDFGNKPEGRNPAYKTVNWAL